MIQSETATALDWNTTFYYDPAWGGLFVNMAADEFHLRTLATRAPLGSPLSQTALNRGSGTKGEYSFTDITGRVRQPGSFDRGAYEQALARATKSGL